MRRVRDDDITTEEIRHPYRSGLQTRRLPLPLKWGAAFAAVAILATLTWITGAFEHTIWGRL